jgi:hypothetical protein
LAANLEPRALMVSWELIFSTVTKRLSIASECTFFSNLLRRRLLRQR